MVKHKVEQEYNLLPPLFEPDKRDRVTVASYLQYISIIQQILIKKRNLTFIEKRLSTKMTRTHNLLGKMKNKGIVDYEMVDKIYYFSFEKHIVNHFKGIKNKTKDNEIVFTESSVRGLIEQINNNLEIISRCKFKIPIGYKSSDKIVFSIETIFITLLEPLYDYELPKYGVIEYKNYHITIFLDYLKNQSHLKVRFIV